MALVLVSPMTIGHLISHVILYTGRTETLGVSYLALAGLCIGIGEILGEPLIMVTVMSF